MSLRKIYSEQKEKEQSTMHTNEQVIQELMLSMQEQERTIKEQKQTIDSLEQIIRQMKDKVVNWNESDLQLKDAKKKLKNAEEQRKENELEQKRLEQARAEVDRNKQQLENKQAELLVKHSVLIERERNLKQTEEDMRKKAEKRAKEEIQTKTENFRKEYLGVHIVLSILYAIQLVIKGYTDSIIPDKIKLAYAYLISLKPLELVACIGCFIAIAFFFGWFYRKYPDEITVFIALVSLTAVVWLAPLIVMQGWSLLLVFAVTQLIYIAIRDGWIIKFLDIITGG